MSRRSRARAAESALAIATPASRPAATAILLDAARHAVPLLPLYLRHGNVAAYLMLTAFDLALGLLVIVGTTRDASDPTTVDPRATWLVSRLTAVVVLAVFFAIVAGIISIPIAMPALIFGLATGVDWWALAADPSFELWVAGMAVVAALRAQHRFEATTAVGERGTSLRAGPIVGDLAGDRRRAKIAYAAQVTLIATFVALSFGLVVLGRAGYLVLPLVYAAILVFYDARPDLAERILPELWRDVDR